MPPGLLRMSWRCVTCGCHGDAYKNAGRAEVIVQRVGAKSRLVTRLTQCCSVRQSDRPSARPPPGCWRFVSLCTLTRLCLCCVNMLKLNSSTSADTRTGPYTSLSGLIIHCLTPMTLLLPSQSCCSVICRIQEAALNKNTRNKLLFTSLIQSYTF